MIPLKYQHLYPTVNYQKWRGIVLVYWLCLPPRATPVNMPIRLEEGYHNLAPSKA